MPEGRAVSYQGYFTARLVSISHHIIVKFHDDLCLDLIGREWNLADTYIIRVTTLPSYGEETVFKMEITGPVRLHDSS